MNGYLNSIIITAAACQIAQMIVPDSDSLKRGIRMLCALAVLLTMLSPVRYLTANYDHISAAIEEWLNDENTAEITEEPMNQIAQAVMEHAVQACRLDPDGMRVTLLTDDTTGELTEIQLFVRRCAFADREDASRRLTEIYGIPVKIYSGTG